MPDDRFDAGARTAREFAQKALSALGHACRAAASAGATTMRDEWSCAAHRSTVPGHGPGTASPGVAPTDVGKGGPAAARPVATMADVEACYRLILDREPDEDGLQSYRSRLAANRLSAPQVAQELLASVEFARLQAARGTGTVRARELSRTSQGFSMWVDPTDFAVGHTVAVTGDYEPEVCAAIRRLLVPGATFVDLGANIGWFSLLGASLVGPAGRVLAVEPNPHNVELLDASARHNGFSNVKAYCVALSESPGMVALETDGSNGRVVALEGPPARPVRAEFVVAAWPLDHLVADAGLGQVDVIKIDVEGAEPLALRGAVALLERDRPVIVTEFYPLALDLAPWGSAQGYLDMLRSAGYRLQVIGQEAAGDRSDAEIFRAAGAPGRDHVDLVCTPE